MQAANNYIRNGYYAEAMNVLEGIAPPDRAARWHYYAALASSGLGNNIRAQNEARTAVDMEPGNYEYQNLLDRLAGVLHLSAGIHPARQPPARHELLFAGLAVPDALQPVQHLLLRWARWILYLLSRG